MHLEKSELKPAPEKKATLGFRLGAILVLFALCTVLLGKLWMRATYELLYVYSAMVSVVLLLQFFTALKLYRDPYRKAREALDDDPDLHGAALPTVTVMVAVKDEETIIARCIDSLRAQTYRPLEIIVVDDGSEDGTGRILDLQREAGGVKVIRLPKNVGKKRALAHAMLRAKGSIFAFTDSDSVLEATAIQRIVDIFRTDASVGAVSGHCRALNADDTWVTRMQDTWYEGQFSIRKAFESHFNAVTCVSGPLAVFRRSAIYNYIPAWENDRFLGQEFRFATDRTMTGFVLGSATVGEGLKRTYADSPFVTGEDHAPRDWKVVYSKSARAWTQVPDTLARVVKQQIRWKKSFIRNIFCTGAFYWKKPLPVSLAYYMHILFVLIGPLIAFKHLVLFPLNGDLFGAAAFFMGIVMVGLLFGLVYRLENGKKDSRWVYRPLMSLLSTLFLSGLVFYSAATIRKNIWTRS